MRNFILVEDEVEYRVFVEVWLCHGLAIVVIILINR